MFHTLRNKFAIPVVLFCSLIFLVLGFLQYQQQSTAENRALFEKATIVLELAVLASVAPVWDYNQPAVIANGEAIFKDPEIAAVEIVVAASGYVPERVLYQKTKLGAAYDHPRSISLSQYIMRDDQLLGTVTITATPAFREAKLQRLLLRLILQNLLTIAFLWAIIFYIARAVSQPITDMAQVMKEITDEGLTSLSAVGLVTSHANRLTANLLSLNRKMAAAIPREAVDTPPAEIPPAEPPLNRPKP